MDESIARAPNGLFMIHILGRGWQSIHPALLTPREEKVLAALVETYTVHRLAFITREALADYVWDCNDVSPEMVDAAVYQLRRKLRKLDPTHDHIITLRGKGYMLRSVRDQELSA